MRIAMSKCSGQAGIQVRNEFGDPPILRVVVDGCIADKYLMGIRHLYVTRGSPNQVPVRRKQLLREWIEVLVHPIDGDDVI